jgi:tRNA 2-thiouridine synthesizing protein A
METMSKNNSKIIIVDAKYKSCPGPIIHLSEAAKTAEPGQMIKLLATDPAAPSDVKEWSSQVGHKVLKISQHDGEFEIEVQIGD